MTEAGPAAAEPPGARELVEILQEFTMEANRYVEQVSGHNAMHRTDLNALAVMIRLSAAGKDVTPGQLRSELNISSPAATALVDRLVAAGHVRRERLGPDRRQIQLQLTRKAYQDGFAMFRPLSASMAEAMADYTTAELEIARRFLADMTAATARARQGGEV